VDTGTLVIGLIVICMGVPLFYFGYTVYKKSHNEKLCRGAVAVVFRSPDKVWVRLLPIKNGLIQKPDGKYLLKREKNIKIPWPEGGYVIPKGSKMPPIKWPINANPAVQSSVGAIVIDVGNPIPREQVGNGVLPNNHESPIDPSTIMAIYNANTAEKIFVEYDKMLDTGVKKGGKLSDLMPYAALIAIGIVLVLVFMIYTNMGTMSNDINQMKGGFGY
jgi:hypothetical protein